MRSIWLIATTMVVLAVAFAAYLRLAPPPARVGATDQNNIAPTPPAPSDPNHPLGVGAGAWVHLYDKDGNFYGDWRSQGYLPDAHDPDSFHLTHPEAEFFQRDGQVVHMLAADGDVRMADQAQRNGMNSGTMDPPNQGIFRDVTIKIFPGPAAVQGDDPDFTIHMNNVEFDTDTNRVMTIAYVDASGQDIAADEVPITVRGHEADFDGTGLTMYWNGRTHELRSLTVPHAMRLVLKNVSALNQKAASNDVPPAPDISQKTEPTKPQASAPARQTIAPAPHAAVSAPEAIQAADTVAQIVHAYIANFPGNVRITQNDQTVVTAEQMDVLFAHRVDQPAAAAQPTPTPAAASPSPAGAPTTPGTPSAPAPTPAAPAKPPSQQPMFITWSGPLTIQPAGDQEAMMVPGQNIVRFKGQPVHIHQNDTDLYGQRAQYDSASGMAEMSGDLHSPLQMLMAGGKSKTTGKITAQYMTFSPSHQHAMFDGMGEGTFVDPTKPDDIVDAAWGKSCDVYLSGGGKNPTVIRQAQLHGRGLVTDGPLRGQEKLYLVANEIVADFNPPADKNHSGPALSRVRADGDAHCFIHMPKEPDEAIQTQHLTVEAAQDAKGNSYPHAITADENVYAWQGEDQLWADHLHATVLPVVAVPSRPGELQAHAGDAAQTHYALHTMLATGHVNVQGKDGARAQGDALSVEDVGAERLVTLLGNPPAIVSSKDGALRGGEINIRPKDNWAKVSGPGVIDMLRSSSPGKPPTPMHVSWQNSAEILGQDNLIEVQGNIQATSKQASGAVDTASADHAILTLVPKPETKPASEKRSVKTADSDDVQMGFMKDKQVRSVDLVGAAQLDSILKSSAGMILRQAFIEGNHINIAAMDKTLSVPGPGRMLLEDHTPTHQSDQSNRGRTAFQWDRQFTFDQGSRRATMDGSVMIAHWPDSAHSGRTTMQADHVVADFEDAQEGPTTGSDEVPLKLKSFDGNGNVQITMIEASGAQTTIDDATSVKYDAVHEILVLSGVDGRPVEVSNDKDTRRSAFQEIDVDTRNNRIIHAVDVLGQTAQ